MSLIDFETADQMTLVTGRLESHILVQLLFSELCTPKQMSRVYLYLVPWVP